jgi:hypothetical protein
MIFLNTGEQTAEKKILLVIIKFKGFFLKKSFIKKSGWCFRIFMALLRNKSIINSCLT